MIFGVVIGTYSSIFIAAPVLIYLGARIAAEATETLASDAEPVTESR
jgi:preprotein translocase subunit SecF